MSNHHMTPTAEMAASARKGLMLRDRFGRGGTDVGVRRAERLIRREPLDDDDVKAMHGYFARHAVDKTTHAHRWGDDEDPSAGYVAWLLWGGDAGEAWARERREELAD